MRLMYIGESAYPGRTGAVMLTGGGGSSPSELKLNSCPSAGKGRVGCLLWEVELFPLVGKGRVGCLLWEVELFPLVGKGRVGCLLWEVEIFPPGSS